MQQIQTTERYDVKLSPEAIAKMRERSELEKAVKKICHDLNDFSDPPKWTPRGLREFIELRFEVEDGLDSLDFDTLKILRDELLESLDILRKEREQNEPKHII
jgi:hypothetical protein